ncbi:MAG TPA: adenylate/guanylate cyclase domain-containing protein [Actinomycetota bacterium]|nr:adenylate/guanylate cyclase domain-containing protein [Actinomycetota bacterium]
MGGRCARSGKVVTALFADVVGSTRLTERLDPEDAREILGGAVGRMVDAVEAFGGTVKDLAGDGVLALFGAPVTHETTRSARSEPPSASCARRATTPARRTWPFASGSRPVSWCSVPRARGDAPSTARPATRWRRAPRSPPGRLRP